LPPLIDGDAESSRACRALNGCGRLANRVLEPLWNSTHIEQIDILWDETLALEGRAGYYDKAGALKDVIQNHLFQILCGPRTTFRWRSTRQARTARHPATPPAARERYDDHAPRGGGRNTGWAVVIVGST
jgi:hypothetical protein